MAKKQELEIVCRQVLTLLANALAGPDQFNSKVIDISAVKKNIPNKLQTKEDARRIAAVTPETE